MNLSDETSPIKAVDISLDEPAPISTVQSLDILILRSNDSRMVTTPRVPLRSGAFFLAVIDDRNEKENKVRSIYSVRCL